VFIVPPVAASPSITSEAVWKLAASLPLKIVILFVFDSTPLYACTP
jgi:hypothetical protein